MDEESPLEPEMASQEETDSEGDALEALRKERDETEDLLLRKQAEFENYRKRVRKEREEQPRQGTKRREESQALSGSI